MLDFSVGSLATDGFVKSSLLILNDFLLLMLYKPDGFNNIYIKLDLQLGHERNLIVHCLKVLPIISCGQLFYRISYVHSEITL